MDHTPHILSFLLWTYGTHMEKSEKKKLDSVVNHESSKVLEDDLLYAKNLYLFLCTVVHIRPKLTTQMRRNSQVIEHENLVLLMEKREIIKN
jgi:hypothetical protein